MKATGKMTIRVTTEDRQNFAELARLLKRPSESDAIRHVMRETLKAFNRLENSQHGQKVRTRK
jgi:hypothetical protein